MPDKTEVTCGDRLRDLGRFIYNHERREFVGRDGGRWAGFFCAMLAVFMAVTPRDRPRYSTKASRMQTRSNPLSPGLGFRPQPHSDNYLIGFDVDNKEKNTKWNSELYTDSLTQYLKFNHPKNKTNDGYYDGTVGSKPFNIQSPGDCTVANKFGYGDGKPCVLVKMNKIVNWYPIGGRTSDDHKEGKNPCTDDSTDAIQIHCHGEYAADQDNIGELLYHSETEDSSACGTIRTDTGRFPYRGKVDRRDVYYQPYIWVQFLKPKANVLINVLCRAYGANIHYEKKQLRGLTRFQIYHKKTTGNN
ncbi:unnamed protein product [Didymodactylos carnosus]|uniref:Uncharacterized protein n=1 Tax=Didymodactylos carnosus TaxID=1234261 RepID=A0A813Z3S5_9BILA|nr:unnamed protein product [Didymodactylos carnosus]CAF0893764.1 unnamed protein product [Didymodactylos carnosus]CAF3573129.1 unnamed protein product [Didymodactylos carnosus]CAF3677541.1 unnamed protein product [Didymodactylos carnosus]